MAMPRGVPHASQLGQEVGVSPWMLVEQARVDAFGAATNDRDPMHLDPEWCARRSPFGGTISFGFLTLSLLTWMSHEALGWSHEDGEGAGGYALNYGFDRIRFIAPVPVGARIRGRFVLRATREVRPGERLNTFEVTVELEGGDRPALVAEWLGLWVDAAGHQRLGTRHG